MVKQGQPELWITAAKHGDRLALAKLLAMCGPRLRARAEARTHLALKAKHSPDDILQEAYLDVVRQIDRFEGHDLTAFVNWSSIILDHKITDAGRAAYCQARDVNREVPVAGTASNSYWDLLDHVIAESGTPSRAVRRQEALDAMLASLSGLSDVYRRVIQLRFLEGFSLAEVARRLGKSEAAVVALTKRALEALRRSMDRLGEFSRGL
jgi:RNA polymerase sigma-70 factor (ECF subfamily)